MTDLTPEQLAQIAAIVNPEPVAPVLTDDQVTEVTSVLRDVLNAVTATVEHVISVLQNAVTPPPQLTAEQAAPPIVDVAPLAEQAPPTESVPGA